MITGNRDYKLQETIEMQPHCRKNPPPHYRFSGDLKGLIILLLLFFILLIPLIPGEDPAPGIVVPSSSTFDSEIIPSWVRPNDLIPTTDGEFAFILNLAFYSPPGTGGHNRFILVKTEDNGSVQWSRSYGFEYTSLCQTADDGYILAGKAQRGGCYPPAYNNRDYPDTMIIKIDSNGRTEWNRTYTDFGEFNCVKSTTDNGFVMLVTRHYTLIPTPTDARQSTYKQSIIKFGSIGNIQWENMYQSVEIADIIQIEDGDYILVGRTEQKIWLLKLEEDGSSHWNNSFIWTDQTSLPSALGKIISTSDGSILITAISRPIHSFDDGKGNVIYSMFKADSTGNLEWRQTWEEQINWGKHSLPSITAPIQTSDSNFVAIGTTGTDMGDTDISFFKTDNQGNEQWRKNFGEREIDEIAVSLVQTKDQGLLLIGILRYSWRDEMFYQTITDDKTFLTKISGEGEILWGLCYDIEINDEEWATKIVETSDQGYALAGITTSYDAKTTDMWMGKTDEEGVLMWHQTYGGAGDEIAEALLQTTEGKYVLAGSTTSYGAGQTDMWMVKTNTLGIMEWNQSYGTPKRERGYYLEETVDNGYVIAGITFSSNLDPLPLQVLIVKTDTMGRMQWNKTYEIPYRNWGSLDNIWPKSFSFLQTKDGGFAFLYPLNYSSIQMVKTDKMGVIEQNNTLDFSFESSAHDGRLFVDFHQTSDTGFLIGISEHFYSYYMEGSILRSALVKTDEAGNIQWIKEWNVWYDFYVFEAIHTTEDRIFAWITFQKAEPLETGHMILKMGLDGTTYWNETYMEEDYSWQKSWWNNWRFERKVYQPLDSVLTTTDEVLFAGYVVYSELEIGDSRDIWVAKMGLNGTVQWSQTYGTSAGWKVITVPFIEFKRSTTVPTTTSSSDASTGFELLPLLVVMVILKKGTKRRKKMLSGDKK
ncbi:MAG: hypothetical protein ACXACP_04550 [Candidatus Hodarchaeales archaeon]|jgi:hypothetical protein